MTISAAIWNILLLPLVLARVYVYMAQAGVTGEEEKKSVEKMSPPYWPVGKLVRYFLD